MEWKNNIWDVILPNWLSYVSRWLKPPTRNGLELARECMKPIRLERQTVVHMRKSSKSPWRNITRGGKSQKEGEVKMFSWHPKLELSRKWKLIEGWWDFWDRIRKGFLPDSCRDNNARTKHPKCLKVVSGSWWPMFPPHTLKKTSDRCP
jgi:hypothetical protein